MASEQPKITVTTNADTYMNISRMFVIEQQQSGRLPVIDRLRIHSGSSGISISVQGCNNGHMSLTEDLINKIINELQKVVPFTAEAKADSKAHWEAINSRSTTEERLRKKYGE